MYAILEKYDMIHSKYLTFGHQATWIAHMHVVEFQKRRLPHAHILLILDQGFKPRTPEIVDAIIQAEIPKRETHPLLYEMVVRCIFHGPCGRGHPNSPCMDPGGKCTCRYPRPYSEHTSTDNDGYPVYRRRDDGVAFTRNNHTFTNRDIVPYNPYLTQKYNCHINVEIATSVTAVKYLYIQVHLQGARPCLCICRESRCSNHRRSQGASRREICVCARGLMEDI
jgi:hypothetical protein